MSRHVLAIGEGKPQLEASPCARPCGDSFLGTAVRLARTMSLQRRASPRHNTEKITGRSGVVTRVGQPVGWTGSDWCPGGLFRPGCLGEQSRAHTTTPRIGRSDEISISPARRMKNIGLWHGFSLVARKGDSATLARKDMSSLVVWGVIPHVSLLALRRELYKATKRQVPAEMFREGKAPEEFVRIQFESEMVRDDVYATAASHFKRLGWRLVKGLAIAQRRLRRIQWFKSRARLGKPVQVANMFEEIAPGRVIPPKRRRADRHAAPDLNALRLAAVNTNGVGSTKPVELGQRCQALQLDIIGVSETHLTGNRTMPRVPGYTWFGLNCKKTGQKGHASGGVGFLVSDAIVPLVSSLKSDHDDQLWIQVHLRGRFSKLFVGCVYMPVDGVEVEQRAEAVSALGESVAKLASKGEVVILGDFNARIGSHTNPRVGASEDKEVNSNGRALLEFMDGHDLTTANAQAPDGCGDGDYTYVRHEQKTQSDKRTVIDHILVSRELGPLVSCYAVDKVWDLSDHRLVWTSLRDVTSIGRRYPAVPQHRPWKLERLRSVEVAHKYRVAMDRELEAVLESGALQGDNLEAAWEAVARAFENTNTTVLGRKHIVKGRSVRWFTPDIRDAARKRRALYKKFKACRTQASWAKFVEQRKLVGNLVRAAKKSDWIEFNKQLDVDRGRIPKRFWSKVKGILNGARPRISKPIKDDAGDVAVTIDRKLEAWAQHYEKLGRPTDDEELFDHEWFSLVEQEVDDMEVSAEVSPVDADVTSAEVMGAIRKLKAGKAAGRDGIRPEMLKAAIVKLPNVEGNDAAKPVIPQVLAQLFTMCLKQMSTPESFRRGQVVSIFKDGDELDRGNYRGITLLSVIGKLMTRILADRLLGMAEEKEWLVDAQGAFRQSRRTEDNALVLMQALMNRRMKGLPTFVLFLDLRKAYDTVWRKGLLHHLHRLGIRGRFFGLLREMYRDTSSSALCDGEESRLFRLSQGVRQGDPISCVLFNIFINDLAEAIMRTEIQGKVQIRDAILRVLLFADDVAIPTASVEDMRALLKVVEAHSRKWRWTANTDKSQLMRVDGLFKPRADGLANPECQLYGVPLAWVQEYKYLGIMFTRDLSWDAHVNKIASKARTAAAAWRRIMSIGHLSRRAKLHLYKAVIRPKLEYASSVWAPNDKMAKKLESIQTRCLKTLVPCGSRTNDWSVRSDLGVQRLSTRRHRQLLKYWFHVRAEVKPDSLVAKAAQWRMTAKNKWAKTPKAFNRIQADESFHLLGVGKETWERKIKAQREMDPNDPENVGVKGLAVAFSKEVDEATLEFERQEWRKAVESSGRYQLAAQLNKGIEHESWFHGSSIGALMKFRIRQSILFAEKPPLECPNCGAPETREHFLVECHSYDELRQPLLKCATDTFRRAVDPMGQVQEMMRDHHPETEKEWEEAIQQFLVQAWRLRGKALPAGSIVRAFAQKNRSGQPPRREVPLDQNNVENEKEVRVISSEHPPREGCLDGGDGCNAMP